MMDIPNTVDIAFTDDGDINFYESNELQYSKIEEISDVDVIIQIIKHRVKSVKPDWFYDNIGANLESILGEENSRETAQIGANLIIDSLTENGFIDEGDIYVRPFPTDAFSIMYYLAVRINEDTALQFKISIALNAGVNVEEA